MSLWAITIIESKLPHICRIWILNDAKHLRDDFKTQPPVDRRFRPVRAGSYCSKQWQPPRTGRNRRSTGGWVLKPPLTAVQQKNDTF